MRQLPPTSNSQTKLPSFLAALPHHAWCLGFVSLRLSPDADSGNADKLRNCLAQEFLRGEGIFPDRAGCLVKQAEVTKLAGSQGPPSTARHDLQKQKQQSPHPAEQCMVTMLRLCTRFRLSQNRHGTASRKLLSQTLPSFPCFEEKGNEMFDADVYTLLQMRGRWRARLQTPAGCRTSNRRPLPPGRSCARCATRTPALPATCASW